MKKVFSSEEVLTSNLFASLLNDKGYETRVQELRGIYFASKYDVFAEIRTPEADIEEVKNQIQVKSISLVPQIEESQLKKNIIFKWVLWIILINIFCGIIYSFLEHF